MFLMGCTEMITLNGRPFSIVEDSGLRRILDPIRIAFKQNNTSAHISPKRLQHYASELQNIVKNKIKGEMKGKLISLQLDLTYHLHRRILAFNIHSSLFDRSILLRKYSKNSMGFSARFGTALLGSAFFLSRTCAACGNWP